MRSYDSILQESRLNVKSEDVTLLHRPVRLRDEHPAHGRRTVRSRHERRADSRPVFPTKCRERFDGHPVDSGSACVGLDTLPSLLHVLPCQNLFHHFGFLLNVPMLPVGAAHTALRPYGRLFRGIRPEVGTFLFGSALPDIESSGLQVTGIFHPPARCSVLWPLLTSRPVARSGPPQVRTRCFMARPPYLPPRLDLMGFAVLCQLARRVGLGIRFLSVGPPFSASLPPPDRLPSRSWLHVMVVMFSHSVLP